MPASSQGVNQSQLEAKVKQHIGSDLVLNILSLYVGNQLMTALFGAMLTPDIEKIFAKMFRQVLGSGTGGVGGGFSTAGIPVGSQSYFGLKPLAPEAGDLARIIATTFGAGGQAFGPER